MKYNHENRISILTVQRSVECPSHVKWFNYTTITLYPSALASCSSPASFQDNDRPYDITNCKSCRTDDYKNDPMVESPPVLPASSWRHPAKCRLISALYWIQQPSHVRRSF